MIKVACELRTGERVREREDGFENSTIEKRRMKRGRRLGEKRRKGREGKQAARRREGERAKTYVRRGVRQLKGGAGECRPFLLLFNLSAKVLTGLNGV